MIICSGNGRKSQRTLTNCCHRFTTPSTRSNVNDLIALGNPRSVSASKIVYGTQFPRSNKCTVIVISWKSICGAIYENVMDTLWLQHIFIERFGFHILKIAFRNAIVLSSLFFSLFFSLQIQPFFQYMIFRCA